MSGLGRCAVHYQRFRRTGKDESSAAQSWRERLAELISTHGPDECWIWTGRLTEDGYGRAGGGRSAHRMAYEALVGPIPPGLQLDHVQARGCRSRACVNPRHLEPVTPTENKLRSTAFSAINAAKTHCDHGHEFTEENTYVDVKGHRNCRACTNAAQRRSKARKRTAALPRDAS